MICAYCQRVAPNDPETGYADDLCPTCRDLWEQQAEVTPRDLVDHAAHELIDVCADLDRAIALTDSEAEMARVRASVIACLESLERVAVKAGQRHEALSQRSV